MNSRLIYAIPYLVIGILSFRDWKKYGSVTFLFFTGFSAVGFSAEMIYFSLIVFNAPQGILSLAGSFFLVFDPILMVTMVWIVVKRLMQK